MKLADKLVLLRKDKGWTQAVAAKNILIQQSYLSKLENDHYQPSNDVIEKLCLAYNVTNEYLVPKQKNKNIREYYALFSSFIGVTLLISGYFSLIFSQTYYTYKTQPLSHVEGSIINLDYHFTDSYSGDKYIRVFSGIKYEYTLISERNVTRKENRWLITIGTFLIIISMVKLMLCFFKNLKLKIA